MTDTQVKFILWRNIFKFVPLLVFFSILITILWQTQKPSTIYEYKQKFAYSSPFFYFKECSRDEKRIAKHFAVDTLPGLLDKGLICRYRRDESGTSIAVCGSLWKERSRFFKTSLLSEISVFNKVQGYAISTKIIDSLSGKLYAYLSQEAKMNFYD